MRRRNFIKSFPYATPVGAHLRHRRLRGDDVDARWSSPKSSGFEARKKASEAKGLKRGIGYSAYIEACGIAPSSIAGALGARAGLFEAGEVRVHPTGKVTVFTGSHSHGQGHETTFAQVVADRLGIPMDDVDDRARRHRQGAVRHGHLRLALAGRRRHGDRQGGGQGHRQGQEDRRAPDGGGRHRRRVYEGGVFKVAGTDKSVPFAAVSLTAYVPHNYPHRQARAGAERERLLRSEQLHLSRPAPTSARSRSIRRPASSGSIASPRCDDFGNVVNPMVVEGQVHGGLAQGIGQALLEHGIYDKESGQLLTG